MNNFKGSIILMGIDWNKAAEKVANKQLKQEDPKLYSVINLLDRNFRERTR
tara:strand:- start:1362 stop:1514 length:153 start_codon:yes stop_codon:yes gene_type:complete